MKNTLALKILGLSALFAINVSAAVPGNLSGLIKIDGSSTVYPITEAVSEEFGKNNPGVKITVGIAGSGGGFKKFCAGEIDISNASRPIKASEIELCKTNKIEYVELPVAYDALSVVVNPKNTWATSITVAELKKLWEPEAQNKITTWNQIRPEWPNQAIKLFGAGVDSGTYDYFTEAVVGKEHSSRGDFTSSEDDNVLVQGVANDRNGLGFFGLAYYMENKNKLKVLSIDDLNASNGNGPQTPSLATVTDGTYQPLARPLFIYIRKDSMKKTEVQEYAKFYINNAKELTTQVGYVPLQDAVYSLAMKKFDKGITGSSFIGGSQVGVKLESLLAKEVG
ncbi:MAG: PstS family phosphate ABC transporter substrate-binding protein [bacterium]|nr:PstS family phosphate ABC transporter substrate-binding protein [bacterium]